MREYSDGGLFFFLAQCGECQVVYVDPPPTESELLARSGEYQSMMRNMLEDLRNSTVGRLGMRLMRDARTPPGAQRGRILDIGCSYGEYLARLRPLGWETSGIELDEAAARHAREELHLEVRTGTAEEWLPDYPDRCFDVVTMWHVLEHLRDPGLVLAHVKRVLKPGGRLMLEVPNYRSIWSTLLRDYWFPLEYPYHLFHFTPSSLRRILVRAGFPEPRIKCQPAPAETTWSFHMLWHRMSGKPWNRRLLWTPTGVVALYPVELLLASVGRSNHMKAIAAKA